MKFCQPCNKNILSNNWNRHIKTAKHMNIVNNITTYNCVECEYTGPTRQSLYSHIKRVHSTIITNEYFCTACNIPIRDLFNAKKHLSNKNHKDLMLSDDYKHCWKTLNFQMDICLFRIPLTNQIYIDESKKYIVKRKTKIDRNTMNTYCENSIENISETIHENKKLHYENKELNYELELLTDKEMIIKIPDKELDNIIYILINKADVITYEKYIAFEYWYEQYSDGSWKKYHENKEIRKKRKFIIIMADALLQLVDDSN